MPDAHLRDLDVERGVSGDRLDYTGFDEPIRRRSRTRSGVAAMRSLSGTG